MDGHHWQTELHVRWRRDHRASPRAVPFSKTSSFWQLFFVKLSLVGTTCLDESTVRSFDLQASGYTCTWPSDRLYRLDRTQLECQQRPHQVVPWFGIDGRQVRSHDRAERDFTMLVSVFLGRDRTFSGKVRACISWLRLAKRGSELGMLGGVMKADRSSCCVGRRECFGMCRISDFS